MCSVGKTLVSFDVDGTLIRTVGDNANKLHKLAFMNAWKEVYGLETHLDVIQHHGNTDPLILIRVAQYHGIAKSDAAAKLKDMEDSMLKYYMANADKAGVGLECLPGVKQLLQELKDRDDVLTCLVTGNLQPIGWAKMEALGIKHLFSEPYFGGFGSDYCNPDNSEQSWKDRAELVKIAAQKAEKHFPGVQWKAKWHVGDTPMDIQAAQGGKAQALGVLTGVYSRQDLEGCGAESITLENLQDVPAVLKAMNL
ncbi:hypothetical protein ABBQ38_003071 [Trebouxia sp. C0009 RCD-2024]